jgi:hypothetical protein
VIPDEADDLDFFAQGSNREETFMKRQANWLVVMVCVFAAFATRGALAQSTLWAASAEQNGISMEATYTELVYGSLCDQTLEVRITNAPANKTLKVLVRNHSIGSVETNEFGFGIFFKGRTAVPVDEEGRADAPRIEEGDVIKVGWILPQRFIMGTFFIQ